MAKYFVYISLFLFGLTDMSAQRTSIEQAVFGLFEKPGKVLWLRHFHGKMDDINDVSIVLAYDGKYCKGRMKYLESEEELGLIGFMKHQKVRLLEVNGQAEVSGFLEGRLNGKELELEWSSLDNTIGSNLVLRESPEAIDKPTDCSSEKWIRTFRGLLDEEEVEFLLQMETEKQIRGLAFFKSLQTSYEVTGKVNKGDEIILTLTDQYKKAKGSLRGHITKKGIVEAIFLNPYGARTKGNFWLHEKMDVSCVTYADYISSLGISYPTSNHSAFNRWMESLVNKWKDSYEEYAKQVRTMGQGLSPETRASARSHGWYNLDFLSVNIISGSMCLSNSWEEETHNISFTFDLNTGRPITLMSIFRRDFNLQDFIWNYISEDIQSHSYYKDYDFRKWLSTASFDTFTIRNEGINFSTPFNATYGHQQVTIPFAKMKKHMNQQSPIWDLAL